MATGNGNAKWTGDLRTGSGELTVGEGAWTSAYSGRSRFAGVLPGFEDSEGTNPEELLAAAHAACFSMALSAGLAREETPADELRTSATVTFQPGEGITRIALTVEGRVPGIDGVAFEEAALGAKENCPVSKALAGVPEITLDAQLLT